MKQSAPDEDDDRPAALSPKTAPTGPPAASFRGRAWFVLKWLLFVAVVAFVAKRGWELWHQDELQEVEIDAGRLVLAGGVYVIAWIPSAWFWQRLMHALGNRVTLGDSVRAFYCGHLGKYIPGKATVLVIRAGLMKSRGFSAAVAAVTATFETLLLMGAGAAVGLALAPWTGWPGWMPRESPAAVVTPLVVVAAVGMSLPLLSRILTWIAVRMTPQGLADPDHVTRIDPKLIAAGLAVFVGCWVLLGLSLGLTLQAVSPEPVDFADLPMWTGAVSLATVIGFLAVFAPGGVGVREGLLITVLLVQPGIGEKQAVAAAVLLRLVWLVAEIFAAAAVYYLMRPEGRVSGE